MKRFLSLLATGALALGLSTTAQAQTRGIGAGALVLDDLHGHAVTVEAPVFGTTAWTAWQAAGFPNLNWSIPVPPANGAQSGFLYDGPLSPNTYGTGGAYNINTSTGPTGPGTPLVTPYTLPIWVNPGYQGFHNYGGAAGAWDYANTNDLGIVTEHPAIPGNVIPKSDPNAADNLIASQLEDVLGTFQINTTTPVFTVADATGNTRVYGTSELDGLVGIGQAPGADALDVTGTVGISSNTTVGGGLAVNGVANYVAVQSTSLSVTGVGTDWTGGATFGGKTLADNNVIIGESNVGGLAEIGANSGDMTVWRDLYINAGAGRVRVGSTTAPVNELDVTGTFGASGMSTLTGVNNTGTFTTSGGAAQINASGTNDVTIGNATGGNVNLAVNSGTTNLTLTGIATDAAPTVMLTLNGTDVRQTLMSGTALEGLVYTSGAYRLGSTLTTGAGSNPFLTSRNVNLDASNLNFTANGGALTPLQIVGTVTPLVNVNTNAVVTATTSANPGLAAVNIRSDYAGGTDARQLLIQGAAHNNQQLEIGYNTTTDVASIQSINQGTGDEPLLLNEAGGRVGVGTGATALNDALEVGANSDGQSVAIRASAAGTSWTGGGAFGGTAATDRAVILGQVGGLATIGGHAGTLSSWQDLYINSGGGNVRVGSTAAPTNTLDVTGTFGASGMSTLAGITNSGAFTTSGGLASINTTTADAITIGEAGANNSATTINIGTGGTGALTLTGIPVSTSTALFLTQDVTGKVWTNTLSNFIQGTNGVLVTTSGGVATAQLGGANTDVLFSSDRYINTDASTLRITGGSPGTDFATFNGSTSTTTITGATNINTTGSGTTTIGNASSATDINGNIYLPQTTATAGAIFINGWRTFHVFGASNTFAGGPSGNVTLTGGSNAGFGTNVLTNLTSGNQNAAMGAYSMVHVTTGNYNTADGYNSLNQVTTGSDNTGIGNNAGVAITTAGQNTAVGSTALQTDNVGYQNTAVGYGALSANTTGFLNTAVGIGALESNVSSAASVGVGGFALAVSTAANNTAVGFDGLRYVTTGGSNSSLGTRSGNTIITGSNNTFLGYQADASGDYSNATAIGANASVAASNEIQLGDGSVTLVNTVGLIQTTGGATITGPVNINATTANTTAIGNGANAITIAGTTGITGATTQTGAFNLAGASSPLQVGGSAGSLNDILTSAGTGATPTWNNTVNLTTGTFQNLFVNPAGATVGITIAGTSTGNDITGNSWQVTKAGALTATNVTDGGLTLGEVTFAGTAGLLSNSANFTWGSNTLTVTGAINSTGTATIATGANLTNTFGNGGGSTQNTIGDNGVNATITQNFLGQSTLAGAGVTNNIGNFGNGTVTDNIIGIVNINTPTGGLTMPNTNIDAAPAIAGNITIGNDNGSLSNTAADGNWTFTQNPKFSSLTPNDIVYAGIGGLLSTSNNLSWNNIASTFAVLGTVNLNTSGAGATSIGNAGANVGIASTTWSITNAGAATFTSAGTGLTVSNNASIGGTLGVTGLTSTNGGLTNTGAFTTSGAAASINNNSNFATSINTGTSTGNVTIGNTGASTNSVAINVGTTGTGLTLGGLTTVAPTGYLGVIAGNEVVISSASVVSGTGTQNTIPKFTATGSTIGNSLLFDDGTTLTYNTNKFTVASATGNTTVAGTLGAGATTLASLNNSSGGVTNAGAVSGVTTMAGTFGGVATVTGTASQPTYDFSVAYPSVTASSTIIITSQQSSAGNYYTPYVAAITAGTGFNVHLSASPASGESVKIHYIVVN